MSNECLTLRSVLSRAMIDRRGARGFLIAIVSWCLSLGLASIRMPADVPDLVGMALFAQVFVLPGSWNAWFLVLRLPVSKRAAVLSMVQFQLGLWCVTVLLIVMRGWELYFDDFALHQMIAWLNTAIFAAAWVMRQYSALPRGRRWMFSGVLAYWIVLYGALALFRVPSKPGAILLATPTLPFLITGLIVDRILPAVIKRRRSWRE